MNTNLLGGVRFRQTHNALVTETQTRDKKKSSSVPVSAQVRLTSHGAEKQKVDTLTRLMMGKEQRMGGEVGHRAGVTCPAAIYKYATISETPSPYANLFLIVIVGSI